MHHIERPWVAWIFKKQLFYHWPVRTSSVFSSEAPCVFNSAHFVRSVINRRPFKNNVFSLPQAGSLPEGYDRISEPLENMNTLIVSEEAFIASTVPVRAGLRSFYDPVVDTTDSGRQRIEKYMLNKHGLSLAILAAIEPDDIYVLGHLSAIYGCPSLLVSLSGTGDAKFIEAFLGEYKKTSAFDAVLRAGTITGGAGKDWVLLGYKGMGPDEAKDFASKRFVKYVKKRKGLI